MCLLACAALAGCAGTPVPDAPIRPTQNLETVTVTWLRVSETEANEQCARLVGRTPGLGQRFGGCSVTRGPQCTIWAPPPASSGDVQGMAILGHEALHCFVGLFHP